MWDCILKHNNIDDDWLERIKESYEKIKRSINEKRQAKRSRKRSMGEADMDM